MSSAARMRHVIFVTRKFHPAVGGMETLAAQTHDALQRKADRVELLALGRSQVHLVWWVPLTLLRLVVLVVRHRPSHILLGDALTHAAMFPVVRWTSPRTAVMVHGLDLTFGLPGYRPIIRHCLRRADHIIANSRSTAGIVTRLGLPTESTHVVHPAVQSPTVTAADRAAAAGQLRSELGLPDDCHVVVTIGRLVRRKGVGWFIENVLPRLPDSCHYLVAGSGPDLDDVREAVAHANMADHVRLLGRVSGEMREILFQGGDVFVQPNIPVSGDVEGFGLVTIEAAMRGMPVVAARLEGIEDAILHGKTGWLCEPRDHEAFREVLTSVLTDPGSQETSQQFQAECHRRFSSESFADRLVRIMQGA